MARVIEIDTPTIGNWAAIDEAMVNDFYEGTFEPTVAIMDWPTDPPSLSIGIHEDGDIIDADGARDLGYHVGRRYGYAGSVGVYGPGVPLFTLYFTEDDRTYDMDSMARTSGETIVEALEDYGVDAVYDHIGDVKFVVDDKQYKAIANAPGKLHESVWGMTVSIIWGELPKGLQDVLDQTVRVPPEKFEDKDEKTVTGRMKPLSLEYDQFGAEVGKREFMDDLVERIVHTFVGEDESIEAAEPDDVLDYVDRMTAFFESDTWVDRRATSRMCRQADPDDTVGVAAYKSRKLVKASLLLEDGVIEDARITGDFYISPQPTVTAEGAPADLDAAIRGLDATDRSALLDAVGAVFDEPDFEIPGVSPEDVVETIVHAAENTMSVEEYLAEHA